MGRKYKTIAIAKKRPMQKIASKNTQPKKLGQMFSFIIVKNKTLTFSSMDDNHKLTSIFLYPYIMIE
jgi:hypothetical protein